MKLFDKYILKQFLVRYVFIMVLFLGIIVVINFVERNDYYIEQKTPIKEIIHYYLDFMPYAASLITPLISFITAVLVTSQLSTHTEIIAALSTGISFKRILMSFVIGSIFIVAFAFYTNGWIIPKSNKDRAAFETKYFRKNTSYKGKNIHIRVNATDYVYMTSYNNKSNTGYNFTLETIDGTLLLSRLESKQVIWVDSIKKWRCPKWIIRTFDKDKETFEQGENLDTALSMSTEDFAYKEWEHEGLTNPELDLMIDDLKNRGIDNTGVYEIEKYIRYMSPFSIFILVILGFIIAARKRRGGAGYTIALGFALAFVFVIMFLFVRSLALSKAMPPILAIWMPNIIFGIITFFLYRKAAQ